MSRARVLSLLPATALALLAALLTAATSPLGTDYGADAGPAIDALLRGDVRGAFAAGPPRGQLSLSLRWPFAGLAPLAGGDGLWTYRAGAVACLLAPAALAVALATISGCHSTGADHRAARALPLSVVLLGVGVLVANPIVVRALELGHPEEAL